MQAKIVILVPLLFFILGGCHSQKNITGKWISESPEKSATGSFGQRQFAIKGDTWEVQATMYLDSSLTLPVFTFRASGKYSITNKSTTVKNTMDAEFEFEKKYITLKTRDTVVIKRFGLNKCNLFYLQESDITETGCAYFASKAICAREYDLVSKMSHRLFLGARPASGGMCEISKRPTALGPALKRVTE